jgi:hypothetical protein
MPKHVQLMASIEILDDQDADEAARQYSEGLLDLAYGSPHATKAWVSTIVADRPLPRPDLHLEF